jgi:hypothetical protein
VENAKTLLQASSASVNPFEGFTPGVPLGETLHFNSKQLDDAEKCVNIQYFSLSFD